MPNEANPNQIMSENNAMSPAARHNARRYAVQAMYQWQLTNHPLAEIEAEFTQYHIDKKTDMAYFKELIHGVPQHREELDQAIQPFLGRPFDEIDPIELAVLRLAVYELAKRPDVPYRVVINEALVLSKKFGSVESHKFVNSILDRVAKKIRVHEPPRESKSNTSKSE
jgi:N utilization substance protein B